MFFIFTVTTDRGIIFEIEDSLVKEKCGNVVNISIPSEYKGSVLIPSIVKNLKGEEIKISQLYGNFPSQNEGVIQIIIEDGIESIGDRYFASCSYIKSITLSKSMRVIPQFAFAGCSCLEDVVNLDCIKIIKTHAFYKSGVEYINLKDSLIEEIEPAAFSKCENLSSFIWPTNCQTIPEKCFYMSNLNLISNLTSVTQIEEKAFMFSNIKNIDLQKSKIFQIDDSAFSGCFDLNTVIWPDECESIPRNCFKNCTSLKRIPHAENVLEIGESAFYGCSSLIEIDLDARMPSLIDIKEEAFCCCSNLRKVNWASNCEIVKNSTFYKCLSLNFVSNLEKVVKLAGFAFAETAIKKLDLSRTSILYISKSCFNGCSEDMELKHPYYEIIIDQETD